MTSKQEKIRELKALKKELSYLKSKKAEKFYLDKATTLLDTLSKKWGVLTQHIENLQREAQQNHVVFGPQGRPRHLWGHFHPDKFVGFGMDRRTFNSIGQGFASDIGYVAIYLLWGLRYDLLINKGHDVLMNLCNAVHDSSLTETEIRYMPLVAYMVEHAMISETTDYYRKHFNTAPKSDYGFDMEIGFDEASLVEWDKRPEGMRDLIIKFGKEAGYSRREIKDVLHDNKIIGDLRRDELKSSNPNHMTLKDPEVYDRIIPKLKMFQKKTRRTN